MVKDIDPFEELDKLKDITKQPNSNGKPKQSSTSFGLNEVDMEKVLGDGWLIISLALFFVILFLFAPTILKYWNRYAIWIITFLILLLIGVSIFYLTIILPNQKEVEAKRRKNEEIEKRIIRKNLEKRRAKELEILDEDERNYLLNKWVEEEYILTLWVEREYLNYINGEKTILTQIVEGMKKK